MHPDVVVVGAGFSGAVMAERFASQADMQVLVLEQRRHIGGNCYDYKNEHGIVVHQYGPHLFHTDKQAVWDYLSSFTSWHHYEHTVLSCVDGKLVPLPFNLNTLEQMYSPEQAGYIESLLIDQYGEGSKVPILTLKEAADPALRELGQLVYDKFFVNYTVKQWGCRPEDIAPEVTARVPVVVSRDNRYFHDSYQAIPANGYTPLFESMLAHENIQVETGCNALERLRLDAESGTIELDGKPFAGKLIYTGTLDSLFGFIDGELPYRSLRFDYETLPQREFQPTTTVNYPNEEAFTRITEFKHILPCHSRYTTIVREYPQQYDRTDPEADVPYYPVFTSENQRAYDHYRQMITHFPTLTVLGRLADYRYYNMDDAVANALSTFATLYN